jgi:hypothetical protein
MIFENAILSYGIFFAKNHRIQANKYFKGIFQKMKQILINLVKR